jgi:hypothetical protein
LLTNANVAKPQSAPSITRSRPNAGVLADPLRDEPGMLDEIDGRVATNGPDAQPRPLGRKTVTKANPHAG